MTRDEILDLAKRHIEAWNDHDLDRLMDLFSEDCVFEASAGGEVTGQSFVGKPAVRAAFAGVLENMPDAHWGGGRHLVIDDDYCVSEWTLTGTAAAGVRVEVNGCDFLTVRDTVIARKNSFRKQRPAIPV